MKKVLYLSLTALLLAATALISKPELKIEGGDAYDWGEVKPGDSPLKAKIKIKNVGDELLKITNVKPGCGCTTAPLDKNEIKPGEHATLSVSLRVGGYSGQVRKSIRITSNDAEKQTRLLWLKAKVVRHLQVSPRKYFYFRNLEVGVEKRVKLTIKNNWEKPIKLSDFETPNDQLEVNLKDEVELEPGETVDIVASVTPKEPGSYRGWVKMKTTDPENKTLSLSVFGRVKKSKIFNNESEGNK